MLAAIRDRATGVIAWVIIGALILVFALFGIQSYVGVEGAPVVATVNGEDISINDYNQALRSRITQEQQIKGEAFDPRVAESAQFKKDTLDQLITITLVKQMVKDWQLNYAKERVVADIAKIPNFEENGKFSKTLFRRLLAQQGISESQFVADMKMQSEIRQLQGGLVATAFMTEREMNQLLRIQSQERELAQLTVSAAALAPSVELTEEDLNAFYDENKQDYFTKERVKLDYLELSADDLMSGITITDQELKKTYEDLKNSVFKSPEQRRARHILVAVDENAPEADKAAAKAKIEAARQRITSGEDFAVVAKEVSEDPGSKDSGGDLGFFGRGAMVPAFEEAAFSSEINELTQPIQSPFGYHLIQVLEAKGGEVKPFEDVKDQVLEQAKKDRVANLFSDKEQALGNETFEQSSSLVPAAEKLGLKIQHSDWVYRDPSKSGVGQYYAVLEAAFSADVLDEKNNSRLISVGDKHVVVVRVAAHEPPTAQPLEEVKPKIESAVREIKAEKAAQDLGLAILEKAKAGQSLQELAKTDGVTLKEPNWYRRGMPGVDENVLNRAFDLVYPEGSESPVLDGIFTTTGDFVVFALSGVRDGKQDFNDDQRKAILANLGNQMGEIEFTQVLESARARADVVTFEERL